MICKEIRASGHYSHSMVATGLGLNVIMPNLSPEQVRKKYELYNNKICTGAEAAQSIAGLYLKIQAAGCRPVTDRGDAPGWRRK